MDATESVGECPRGLRPGPRTAIGRVKGHSERKRGTAMLFEIFVVLWVGVLFVAVYFFASP